MKYFKYIYSLIVGLLITINAFGQVELNETYTNFDNEWAAATSTVIPMNDKDLEEEWEEYLEENYEIELDKVKSKRDTTLYISKNVIRNNLSDTTYSIYTKIVERQDGNSDLYTFWIFDENRLLNTKEHPEKVKDSKAIMSDFARNVYIKHYKQEIEMIQKRQKRLEHEYNSLESRNDKLEKRNERYREKTKAYQDKIILNKESKDDNLLKMKDLKIIYEGLDQRVGLLEYHLNTLLQKI